MNPKKFSLFGLQVGIGRLILRGRFFQSVAPATINTAGAVTLTAAQLVESNLLLCDPNGAGRTYTTPTATLILAAIRGAVVGTSFTFRIVNTADAAEAITVAAGTGVTLVGNMVVGQNQSKEFLVRITGVSTPAVSIYGLGNTSTN